MENTANIEIRVLKNDKRADNFKSKTDILGIGLKDKVEMLNGMYKDKIVFDLDNDGIYIANYNESLISIQLPEISELNIKRLISTSFHRPIVSIKLPKCLPYINLSECYWVHNIQRLFLWDTTEIEYGEFQPAHFSPLNMIIIQSSSGKNPKIIKFTNRKM